MDVERLKSGQAGGPAHTKVRMKAKEFGVFTGKSGEIYHFNPKSDDERYHSPVINAEDVAAAEQRGLGEKATGAAAKNVVIPESTVGPTVATVGAERVAEHAKVDHQVAPQPSALDTRGTVAWGDPERVLGGAPQGRFDGTGNSEGDIDMPPAPGAPTAQTAPQRSTVPRAALPASKRKPSPKSKAKDAPAAAKAQTPLPADPPPPPASGSGEGSGSGEA